MDLGEVVIGSEAFEILISWLKFHEGDIALGMNDFGELRPIFEELFLCEARG